LFTVAKLKDNFSTRFIFSLSRVSYPFSNQSKRWFKYRTKEGYYLGTLESILLWFFAGAFILAV